MQPPLPDPVKDAIGATSVLLVFVTVLFNAKYADIRARVGSQRPATPAGVRVWKQDLWDALVFHVVPVLVLSGGASLVFLPVVKMIVTERRPAYWDNLDFAASTFVFVFLVVTSLAIWSGFRGVQLLRKWLSAVRYLRENA